MHDFGDVAPLAIAPVVSPRGSLPASDVGTQEPTMRHQFGFVMGLIITAAMAIDAITARVRGLERADTVVAHAVFVGIPLPLVPYPGALGAPRACAHQCVGRGPRSLPILGLCRRELESHDRHAATPSDIRDDQAARRP